ncbi:MAG: TIGR00341 family protein [Patescibacteria group bacterium]
MLPILSNIWDIEPTLQDKKSAVKRLIDDSSPTGGFYLMLVSATMIVAVGLMIGNAAIVIGGMIVSPLLAPFLSLALGVAMGDRKVAVRSLWIILITSLFVFVITLALGLLYPFNGVNAEIVTRIEPSLGYLLIAIFAGVAATYSYVKPKFSETLSGVAIAIAVLPPLCVSALGLVLWDFDIVFGAFALYLVNLMGIVLASVTLFAIFGFYPLRERAEREVQQETGESTGIK